jgi:sugar-specific transcriptional regulator TrmB
MTLVTIGSSTARHASRFAQVPRQDIYRILTELQQCGLVEKIITTPAKFTAIPIQEVVSILLERRIKETTELQVRTGELIQRVTMKVKTAIPQENQHFVLIPEREALINRIKKAIETAQESIDLISSGAALPQVLFILAEKFKEAMRKGVKIRYIVHKPEDANSWPEIVPVLTKHLSFELRTLPDPPDTRCWICDKKEMFIATFPSRGAFRSPALWSNNLSLIVAIHDHFEKVWITAMESKL